MLDGTIASAMNFYLLAGGFSSRMSHPKEELLLDGRTFLERIAAAASPLFDEVVVVRRRDQEAVGGLRNLIDADHEEAAAIHGVRRALEDSPAGKLWISAVDRPLLTAAVLGDLSRRFIRSSAELFAVRADGNVDLLCAGWSTSLLPAVERRIAAGRFRLQEVLSEASAELIEATSLDWEARRALENINRPADYERLKRNGETQ